MLAMDVSRFDPMDHDTNGFDLLALSMLAGRASSTSPFAEVGSWAGLTALTLAQHSNVYCVDHWAGNAFDRLGAVADEVGGPDVAFRTFCRNMGQNLFDRVYPCRGSSKEWARIFKESEFSFSLVFIDAEHTNEAVTEDINLWLPLVERGGILCGHDYGSFPGVTTAVDQRFKNLVHRAGRSLWYVTKLDIE